ncbi:unnamed protein product [Polarella glacialis]|uniref:Sacsin/Nov domain-containing protein n=1 Tax=Polarella glacialis TaxID=89957 RepID=A0A813EEK5_POLGL|nr:unnamed protein product [Polarella glacialis]
MEVRLETVEGQLAEAQRRAEEAEARFASAFQVVTSEAAVDDAVDAPGSGIEAKTHEDHIDQPGSCTGHGLVSAEAAFVADVRRRRLVADDGSLLADMPAHVRQGVERLSVSLCAAVERLASDLYESECHFLYELVQNAEDAHSRNRQTCEEEPTLSFKIGPASHDYPCGYFVSENNEAGFTDRDVSALCDISASSKKRPLPGASGGSIGCKGIGFKSVFTVSDRPHVLSGGFTFMFDIVGPLGKLGYVTPTWLPSDSLQALPAEVRTAHAAGRTVLFLPLRSPGFSAAIAREMDELEGQGRAALLFLRRLSCLELLREGQAPRVVLRRLAKDARSYQCEVAGLQSTAILIESEKEGQRTSQLHKYLTYRHRVNASLDCVGDPVGADMVLAFVQQPPEMPSPKSEEASKAEAEAKDDVGTRLEPLFCSLPIRMVGFGFALHCDCFDLVANRSDLHRGSVVNRAVRDALPSAFAAACCALSEAAASRAQRGKSDDGNAEELHEFA